MVSVVHYSPDPTTDFETANPNFHEFVKIRENSRFVVSELVVGSSEKDIGTNFILQQLFIPFCLETSALHFD